MGPKQGNTGSQRHDGLGNAGSERRNAHGNAGSQRCDGPGNGGSQRHDGRRWKHELRPGQTIRVIEAWVARGLKLLEMLLLPMTVHDDVSMGQQ